jgi:hypothetical protein
VPDPADDSTAVRSDLSEPVTVALYPGLAICHTGTRNKKDEDKLDVSIRIKNYNIATYNFATRFCKNAFKILLFYYYIILYL